MLARSWKVIRLWGAALVGGLALSAAAQAQNGAGPSMNGAGPMIEGAGCATCAPCVRYEAQTHHCPKHLKYHQEGPPKLCFKKACPKPICDPCELKHYGYYQPCWHPYPFPPDWSHCAAPPVGALLPTCCPHRSQTKTEEKKMPDAEPLPRPTPNEGARTNQPPTWLPPPTGRPEPLNTSPVRYQEPPANAPQGPPLRQTSAPSPYQSSPPPRPLPVMNDNSWSPPPPPAKEGPPLNPIRRTSLEEPAESGVVKQAVAQEPTTTGVPTESNVKILAGPGATPIKTVSVKPEVEGERPRPAQKKHPILPGVRMVNSQQILLDFNAAELSPEQRDGLELWWTRDGKKWARDGAARFQDNAILTQVKEEGTFGFSVIQHQRDGTGPQPTDKPQMWVEADWNKPVVKLLDARYQRTAQNRQIALAWTADDRNLAEQPVALSYATKPEGPWTTFAPSVANTGRYIWSLPGHVTSPIFVRVEAFDLMGNVGQDQLAQPIATSPTGGVASRY